MLKILKDENAATEKMAEAYVKIESYISNELTTEKNRLHDELVELETQAMQGGENVTAKQKKTKSELDGIEIKMEACQRALETLKTRMVAQMPDESRKRKAELHEVFESLMNEEKTLYREFLRQAAKAVAIYEQIHGIPLSDDSKGNWTPSLPELHVDPARFAEPEFEFFVPLVEKFRQKLSPSIEERKACISTEMGRLEKAAQNPETAVDTLIDSCRPKEQVPGSVMIDHSAGPRRCSVHVIEPPPPDAW